MKKSIYLLSGIAVLSLAGCSEKDKYAAFAEDFCVCMRPMHEFQEKFMKMMTAGESDETMQALLEEGQKLDQEGQACFTALEEKHGRFEGEEEAKAMEALRKSCPDIMQTIGEAPAPAPEDFMEEEEGAMPSTDTTAAGGQ